jgi:hypothetical protein
VDELNVMFKRLILLTALIVLISVGIVYALSYRFKPGDSTQTLPTANGVYSQPGLELTMTLEKDEYSLGEPVNVTLIVTNVSNQTINFLHLAPTFDFQVYNDTNNLLYQDSVYKAQPMIMYYTPLHAGENLSAVLVWAQTCNNTIPSPQGIPVSAGTYYIIGLYDTYGLRTTPIQITIVEPAADPSGGLIGNVPHSN